MIDSYQTISNRSESLFKDKGSKFIGIALPVASEEEIKESLGEIRKTYYDARHHCYAYILGNNGEKTRANDDGEPNHSAGDPILGQIKSKSLTNTLVVVVRYFGGTKLGVSGLINAYKTASQEALDSNSIIEVEITDTVEFQFTYEQMNEIMKLVKDFDLAIIEQHFEIECRLVANIIISKTDQLTTKVQLMNDTGTQFNFKVL
jgi:uncharacterized YigZ family protein